MLVSHRHASPGSGGHALLPGSEHAQAYLLCVVFCAREGSGAVGLSLLFVVVVAVAAAAALAVACVESLSQSRLCAANKHVIHHRNSQPNPPTHLNVG